VGQVEVGEPVEYITELRVAAEERNNDEFKDVPMLTDVLHPLIVSQLTPLSHFLSYLTIADSTGVIVPQKWCNL